MPAPAPTSGPLRSCESATVDTCDSAASALPVADGSVASAATSAEGRSPRTSSREKPAGNTIANWISPRASISSTSATLAGRRNEGEVTGVGERGRDAAREFGAVVVDDGRRQRLGIGIDDEPEQQHLHDRYADDHRERQPVAPHLHEFLQRDRIGSRERESRATASADQRASAVALLHQVDEHVLERGRRARNVERPPCTCRFERRVERRRVTARYAQCRAERNHGVDARDRADFARKARELPLVARAAQRDAPRRQPGAARSPRPAFLRRAACRD